MDICYTKVAPPPVHSDYVPVDLSAETMREHFDKVMQRMKETDLDVLAIYADREHGANFAYLTGFEPRFEEAVLLVYRDGKCVLMLGNENLKMSRYSFVKGEVIHVPHFSLPNQPMEPQRSMRELMKDAGICDRMTIGCVGWKCFTGGRPDDSNLIDVPYFIVDALKACSPNGCVRSAGALFLDETYGVRHVVNANELAHYEAGAGQASASVLAALNDMMPGKTELEVAKKLVTCGQPTTVTTICASGERFTNAVVFPRNKALCRGERISVTLGLRGGLTSRAAYLCECVEELPGGERDYVEKVVIPYYKAAVTWYETVGIGVKCKTLYEEIERVLPKKKYGWFLNPGHYTGAEEWTASPVYPESEVALKSGMILQMDMIPSVPGYGGVSAEDGVAIADETLRRELQSKYLQTWARIVNRRNYMEQCLGIRLKEEILPMSDICGYLRPLVLNREYALRKR